ncbi:polysaccharide deacetylase family protein [Neofusicoccum parvum]|uniref:Polysaccharide deacetylase family protein n=1 Tax=Neofusicoccum parvum TaxID=310453 RepID=A0ACB5SL24_9PEZI|nr:polysaccharide deacetylase family protein [Neofusicoccum parvum]
MESTAASPTTPKIRVVLSIDFDAVSGWLGTGAHPANNLADYSSGHFAARVGVPRLLRLFAKHAIADRVTWFVPGHSAESFPAQMRAIVASGAEVACHGYAHEDAARLTPAQERDVVKRCVEVLVEAGAPRPVGWRAPLYSVREGTLDLLQELGFEYDASLTDHDSQAFWAPRRLPIEPIDFDKPAETWMKPLPSAGDGEEDRRPLVEVPCNWYMEDMTPMQFLPHAPNSHGYVDTRHIEQMWKDRFMWLWENEAEEGKECLFPILLHPDTSGMAHVIGMVERMIKWLQSWGPVVEFSQTKDIARIFRERNL